MAIGLISALRAGGRRVPEDCSVIGTDDMPEVRYLTPALSTVAVDFEGEGAYIVGALVARIDGSGERPPALNVPRLRPRGSTASA
jgi:DNA-binding LacI/PurR family transcriptional regulator